MMELPRNDGRHEVTTGEEAAQPRARPPQQQRSHMQERRIANQSLTPIKGSADEDAAIAAESKARVAVIKSKREAFRKTPDTPLKEVLERKRVTGRRFLAIAPLK